MQPLRERGWLDRRRRSGLRLGQGERLRDGVVGCVEGTGVEVDPEKSWRIAAGVEMESLAWGRGVVYSERGAAFGFAVLWLGLMEAEW